MIMAKEAKGKKNRARDKENRARISAPDADHGHLKPMIMKQKVSFRIPAPPAGTISLVADVVVLSKRKAKLYF
jgi:hypothetical protein